MWFQGPYRNARLIFAEFFNKNSEGVGLRNVFFKLPINNTDMGICVIDVVGKMGGLKYGPLLKAFFKSGLN